MILHSRPWLNDDDRLVVDQAINSEWIGTGKKTQQFETELANWVYGSFGVSTGSGTAALQLALKALSCGPGDEVVMPTYVCRSLLTSVLQCGAKPILCDAGSDWIAEAPQFAAKLTRRTKCIIAPHLYGLFCDIDAIAELGMPVIEDFAQALPERRSRSLRSDYAVFSFHPTKCITTGEGGMVVAKSAEGAARLKEIMGMTSNSLVGPAFPRLSDIAASLGLSQLARYDEFLSRRVRMAEKYAECIRNSSAEVRWYKARKSMFFRFPVHWRSGFQLAAERMEKFGVTVRRGVDELMHRLIGESDELYPNATFHYDKTVSLPIYPSLDNTDLRICLDACEKVFEKQPRENESHYEFR
ncbi:MAG TPA: DegT/DnrJ/EryC1/StrS family aminotransferase [Opitutaceae bacterium]|nr:DegT/DnrJ/EryC1/StrS family aminotransferase [Opitutaceae bacterium]